MTTWTVRVTENIQVGLRKIGRLLTDISDEEIEKGLEAARDEMRGGFPNGPSSLGRYTVELPPSGRNVRTGNFGRSTDWVREGRSFRVVSNAYGRSGYNYSSDLVGDGTGGGQKWWAAGRWPVAAEVMRKWALAILKEAERRVKSEVEVRL